MKNIKDLAVEIAKREGLKKEMSIAQISEILGIISDLVYDAPNNIIITLFRKNGDRRYKKTLKPKRKKKK